MSAENTFASGRGIAALAFLKGVLVNRPVSVGEVERQARAAKLLRTDESLTHSKLFKIAKKNLRVVSSRHGFGRGGQWLWSLPPDSRLDVGGSAELSTKRSAAVIYGTDSSAENVTANATDPQTTSKFCAKRPRCIGVPTEWSLGISCLDPLRPPSGVTPHRWQLFLADSEGFLDHWACKAFALGWDAQSLFGCTATLPLANLGRAGLVWVLGGRKLIRLYPDWASIESAKGSLHVFNRRAAIYGGQIALPWHLR